MTRPQAIVIFVLSALIAILTAAAPLKAASPVQCYTHGDANKLAYCLRLTSRGAAAVNTAGMERGTAQLYTILAAQQVAPPTVMPAGGAYYPYGYLPVGTAYAEPNATAAIGNVAAGMMSAAAWVYNWKHGYVGAGGIWGAAYLMNYPW